MKADIISKKPYPSPSGMANYETAAEGMLPLNTKQLSRRHPQLLFWLSIGRLNTTNEDSLIRFKRPYLPAEREAEGVALASHSKRNLAFMATSRERQLPVEPSEGVISSKVATPWKLTPGSLLHQA